MVVGLFQSSEQVFPVPDMLPQISRGNASVLGHLHVDRKGNVRTRFRYYGRLSPRFVFPGGRNPFGPPATASGVWSYFQFVLKMPFCSFQLRSTFKFPFPVCSAKVGQLFVLPDIARRERTKHGPKASAPVTEGHDLLQLKDAAVVDVDLLENLGGSRFHHFGRDLATTVEKSLEPLHYGSQADEELGALDSTSSVEIADAK
mmetsp:Transcript_3014/g.7313  ORF Transcript_3014/g.7313 Transcript_3014/m.7313 type:complete len:202 (-) Transcript_3014:517-1122(-)